MKNNTLKTYMRYLVAALGSSLILSIYTFVDSICIGQYEKEFGSAAVAVCMPVWTLIYSTGLLFAMGGATLMMAERGRGKMDKGNAYFTLSFVLGVISSILLTILFIIFQEPLLKLFGAKNSEVLKLAKNYTFYMKLALPFYLMSQYMVVMVRNDGDPGLATIAVLAGGIINSVLDIFFVFGLDMGISGAGLGTMFGQISTAIIPAIHFLKKKNNLRFVKVYGIPHKAMKILKIGISSFVLDICMGITIILFNNQIDRYASEDELIATQAIYGAICNTVVLIQGFGYAIGQAQEPLLSESLGEGNISSVKKYKRYGLISAVVLAILSFVIMALLPELLLKMLADAEAGSITINIGVKILRTYFIAFLFMPLNIVFIYYFNSILKPKEAFILSICRGLAFPVILLLVLPVIDFDLIWLMPLISEALVLLTALVLNKRSMLKEYEVEEIKN
ncbi:MAG: hypothetical protein K6G48_01825 [Acholeplasmatales bacterium]|nr:hypothetical protein [Acholeplasmatales bacterium]